MSRYYRNQLGDEQQRIFQRLVNGENIFLTGNAGTGKSFLVEAYNEYCEENHIKLVKTAPTGVAACNIRGATLHKTFALKTDTKSMLKEETTLPDKVEKILNLASAVLIDEISMVRIDVFDKIMNYISIANAKRAEEKRKDIQLILVGDFYQLAPVIPPEDKKMLDLYYGRDIGNGFAFQSKYWQTLKVQFEKLTEIKRQDDDKEFCTALDKCKEGDTDCLTFFAFNTAKAEVKDAIWVCGKNLTAYDKNMAALEKIKEKTYTSHAVYKGDVSSKDKLCEDVFTYKKGARVLMLINDKSGAFNNGTMGTIKEITDQYIVVSVEKEENGKIKTVDVSVEPYEFVKSEYRAVETKKEIVDERGNKQTVSRTELVLVDVGKAVQYPMKLGFAVTVHKAQGQTYDKMNFTPEIFQDGQLYVALSRCKSADKLYIDSPLNERMVRTAQEVVKYYKNPENYSFFGKENDIISVQMPRECEGAAKLLAFVYHEHKTEVLDYLQALEKVTVGTNKLKQDNVLVTDGASKQTERFADDAESLVTKKNGQLSFALG